MATIYQQVDDLKKRLKVKQARIQEMEARQRSAEKKKKRRDDTRRKIMIGAAVQARVKNGKTPQEAQARQEKLTALLDQFLTRPQDRALFEDLGPQTKDETTN